MSIVEMILWPVGFAVLLSGMWLLRSRRHQRTDLTAQIADTAGSITALHRVIGIDPALDPQSAPPAKPEKASTDRVEIVDRGSYFCIYYYERPSQKYPYSPCSSQMADTREQAERKARQLLQRMREGERVRTIEAP